MNHLSFTQWQVGLDWAAQIAGETVRTEAGQISYAVLVHSPPPGGGGSAKDILRAAGPGMSFADPP